MRRILYLRVPCFHASVQALLDPGLRGRPVIVVAGEPPRGRVVGVSPEAAAAGAERGMLWRHAQRRCPDAVRVRYDREFYVPVVEQLGHIAARWTPWVERLRNAEDEFFANLGLGSLDEGTEIACQVHRQVAEELHLPAWCGIATGKLAARSLVESGRVDGYPRSGWMDRVDEYPRSGWMDGRRGGPSIFTLPQGAERRFLRPLPVEYLWDLKPEALRRLRLLGLRTLGQVAAQPARTLVQPLGPAARWYRNLVRGIDRRPVTTWQPSPAEIAACFVEEDEPDRLLLEGYLQELSQRLAGALVRSGHYGRTVSLVLHLPGGRRRFATRHLKEPTNLWLAIFRTARSLLDTAAGTGPSPPPADTPPAVRVEVLELRVGRLETQGAIQLSIFGDEDRGPALRSAIARIQNRFGEEVIATGTRWQSGSRKKSR